MYAELTTDRAEWKQIRSLLCPGKGMSFYSNRVTDSMPAGRRLIVPLSFLHLADSMQVARQSMGLWRAAEAFAPYARSMQWNNHLLRDLLGAAPWVNLHINEHCARTSNAAADALANFALDSKTDVYQCPRVCEALGLVLRANGANLVLYSDGASRGNPGPASAGAILCLVGDDIDDRITCQYSFLHAPNTVKCVVIACIAKQLGSVTNSVAEYESACIGRRLLIDWLSVNDFIV